MTGAGEVIKTARPDVTIVATEPAGAALLSGDEWNPHKIQGWTPDFIPEVLSRDVYDELIPVIRRSGRSKSPRLLGGERRHFRGHLIGCDARSGVRGGRKSGDRRSVILSPCCRTPVNGTSVRHYSKVWTKDRMTSGLPQQ